MRPKIQSSIIVLLSEARRFIETRPRVSAGIAVLLLASLMGWFFWDTSEELTLDQVQRVRRFVILTQSAAVRDHFNRVIEDGRLTLNETLGVIETAKQAEPGYGLISDQEKNNNK